MNNKESLMLIDGMALLFRGFFATSYRGQFMRNEDGIPTNAIYGFLRYLVDAIEEFQPSHMICCWDMGSKTFRNELYAPYKGNRSEPPEELIPQFDMVKEVTESLGIVNIGVEGYEADDVIGTIARNVSERIHVSILTGDHDSLQLVDDSVHVIIMKKGLSNYAVYTKETLKEEKGLTASQIIDLKGLMGDSSDNYPGVSGIGEKTALKLLIEFETIENILENLSKLSKGIRAKIENDKAMLLLSQRLATICCDVPVTYELERCEWKFDSTTARKRLQGLKSRQLLGMLDKIKVPISN